MELYFHGRNLCLFVDPKLILPMDIFLYPYKDSLQDDEAIE